MPAALATLICIQVSLPRDLPGEDESGPWARSWTTGFHKQTVPGSVWLGRTNLAGDGQADLENHGGVDKAVNVYPSEHYPFWRERLQMPELPYGGFGENFTVAGLNEDTVWIGDIYRIGQAVVQVSQPRQPCWKLARRWRIGDLAAQVVETGRTGWYLRVLEVGEVAAGMNVELVERPVAEWTITAANDVMHHRKHDLAAAVALVACPLLSASWRKSLAARR